MTRKLAILAAILILPIAGLAIWQFLYPPFEVIPPAPRPPIDRAYCTTGIERVRVVHFVPGNLKKKVVIDEFDSEFGRHAKDLLTSFWDGEVTVVATQNFGSTLPLSDKEIALVIFQREDGVWASFAQTYKKNTFASTLKNTSTNEGLPKKRPVHNAHRFLNFKTPAPAVAFSFEKQGNWTLDYLEYEPELYRRSLQDLTKGRCDRIMSSAVSGSLQNRRENLEIGEF